MEWNFDFSSQKKKKNPADHFANLSSSEHRAAPWGSSFLSLGIAPPGSALPAQHTSGVVGSTGENRQKEGEEETVTIENNGAANERRLKTPGLAEMAP